MYFVFFAFVEVYGGDEGIDVGGDVYDDIVSEIKDVYVGEECVWVILNYVVCWEVYGEYLERGKLYDGVKFYAFDERIDYECWSDDSECYLV